MSHRRDALIGIGCLAGALFLVAPALGLSPPLAYRNTSPSVPLGWWVYSTKWPPERGDVVAMKGAPFWPLPILLKRVEGVAGDRFCWIDDQTRAVPRRRHWINHAPMPVLDPLAFELERRHPGFTIWRGCRTLAADEIAGFGDGPLAYGSSFFGPVKLSQLWGTYHQ